MCGILGSVNISSTHQYLESIKHRGPDACGDNSYFVNGHEVTFLHRRLSILDLTDTGSQPMSTSDKKESIIFNGEIYNHEDLRRELGDISFEGTSDTETILKYFRCNDLTTGTCQLNGIFAIAYLEIERQKLYLIRDRFGVKPLYYYFQNNTLIFSSEIRPLQEYLNQSIDVGILLNSLSLRYTFAPLTIYKNIFKVEPGQILKFDLGSPSLNMQKSYFVSNNRKLGTRKDDSKLLTKEYGDLFEKAVERQLLADVEIGVLLSGGIDSALVAAIAAQKSRIKLKAFTVGFDENDEKNDIDEISYAKETADLLGLEHFHDRITFNDFLGSFQKIVKIVEEPLATTSIIPMYSLSKLASSKVKVVLSGQGADEPLGGYNKYKGLLWLAKARPFYRLFSILKLFKPLYNNHESFRRVLSAMQEGNILESYLAFNTITSLEEIKSLLSTYGQNILLETHSLINNVFKNIWNERSPPASSIKDTFLYYDVRSSLADDLLMYTDKVTMHFGLECRVPILDNHLIEFIESLKSSYKYNFHHGKLIHKAFAAEYLPASIINRKKLGFKSPTEIWFKSSKRLIENILSSGEKFSKIFKSSQLIKLLNEHSNGRNLEKQIFLLLSIYYLIQNDHD